MYTARYVYQTPPIKWKHKLIYSFTNHIIKNKIKYAYALHIPVTLLEKKNARLVLFQKLS
jgi:hypothetical protein